MEKILMIDNYDSFTYNLVHDIKELGTDVTVFRNDKFDLEEVKNFQKIILSPGPGIPDEAGLLKPLIEKYATTKSIFGVCLGLQAIAEVFGGKTINLPDVYHGVATEVTLTVEDDYLFKNLENKFSVGRYHSWVVDANLPECLEITSIDKKNQVMSARHKTLDIRGVQYHPESILTPNGKQILKNWVAHTPTF